jgi:FkbM family methyltransferase
MFLSPTENLSYLLGMAEPHLQGIIQRYVSSGDVVYDIGANMGYVSLSLAKQVGPLGRVIAFEPLPQNADLLRRNIESNKLTNIELWPVAASDAGGEAVIRVSGNLATASLVWHRHEPSAIKLSVNTVMIDDLVDTEKIPLPKFVKIDVEGAEGAVLRGMHRTIAAARPVLFIECSDLGRETSWQLFSDLEYYCQSAITRRTIKVFDDYRHSDFLWIPRERAKVNSKMFRTQSS